MVVRDVKVLNMRNLEKRHKSQGARVGYVAPTLAGIVDIQSSEMGGPEACWLIGYFVVACKLVNFVRRADKVELAVPSCSINPASG